MVDAKWIETVDVESIEREDVIRFDVGDVSLAIYRTADGNVYATDGYCTHEKFHLANGLVMGNLIECPKHNGRIDFTTGRAARAPVCIDIRTYPVKIAGAKILVRMDDI